MSVEPAFLSEIATAEMPAGLAIRSKTMLGPGKPGPELEFLGAPDSAIELAHGILESVADWKKKYKK